jgi:hypothetical protein
VEAVETCAAQPPATAVPDLALTSYTAIRPDRLVDTRDGTGGRRGAIGRGCTLVVTLGSGSVPAEATAASLSVTAISPVRGFLTVYACDQGRPATSTLNTRAGIATPNLAVAVLDADRKVCIYSNQGSDVVIDLAGWWSPGAQRVGTVPPVRAYDSRVATPGSRLPAGAVRDVAVGGAFVPAGSVAAIVNLTVTDATRRGFLVAYPCGNPPPDVGSNVNFLAGESRAVAAIVGLGAGGPAAGRLCVRANVDVHFVVDVVGFYAPTPQFGPTAELIRTTPTRLADSRNGTGGWSTPFAPGEVRMLDPVAGGGLADRASAVMLNVVATDGARPGHVRVYPCVTPVPNVSSLNYPTAGPLTNSVANLVTVELDARRRICVYAHTATHVVIDRVGTFGAPTGSLIERVGLGSFPVWPPFRAEATDYGVRCTGASHTIDVVVEPLPGVSVRIGGVPAPTGQRTVVAGTDELFTVQATRAGASATYHFRCLPTDFPNLDVQRPGNPAPGWYLTTFGQGTSPSGKFVVILDHFGAPVWYKRIPGANRPIVNAHRLPDGTIAATDLGTFYGSTDDDLAHRLFDLDGDALAVIRSDDPVGWPIDHHDVEFLADGGRADVAYPLRTGVDLTALGAGYAADEWVVDSAIREFDADGNVVWEWSSVAAFDIVETTYPQRFARYRPIVAGAQGEVDLIHINSIDVQPDGDYVVSARHLDNVFRVDRATGGIDWILRGSPVPTVPRPDDVLTIVGDPLNGPLRPHDARLEGDVLTMFDNRTETGGPARAVAYRIDPTARTATLLWQITEPLGRPSNATGSVRVQPDGAVLVDWGLPLQPMFEEFDAFGNSIMRISQLPFGNSYRIIKYSPGDFNRGVLRAKAGGTLEY